MGAACGRGPTLVELALAAGHDLGQIEAEILGCGELDEESQAALWLYAWCRQDRRRAGSLQPPGLGIARQPGAPGEIGGLGREYGA